MHTFNAGKKAVEPVPVGQYDKPGDSVPNADEVRAMEEPAPQTYPLDVVTLIHKLTKRGELSLSRSCVGYRATLRTDKGLVEVEAALVTTDPLVSALIQLEQKLVEVK